MCDCVRVDRVWAEQHPPMIHDVLTPETVFYRKEIKLIVDEV